MKCAKRDKERGGPADFLSFFKKIGKCAKREKRCQKGHKGKVKAKVKIEVEEKRVSSRE